MDQSPEDVSSCWTTSPGAKLEFLSSKSQTAQPFLFSLSPTPTPAPTGPKDQIKHCGGNGNNDLTVFCSIPLHKSPDCYFEITISALPTDGVVVIGLQKSVPTTQTLPGWTTGTLGFHSDDGNFFKDDGEKGKKLAPPYGPNMVIGCGITADKRVFFNHGGKVYKAKALDDPAEWHPAIGFDQPGCVVSINMKAKSPLPRWYPAAPPPNYAWGPLIGNPLGQIPIQAHQPQTCRLFSLPTDVLKLLVAEGMSCKILETCRMAYKLAPLFTWVNLSSFHCQVVSNFYADTRQSYSRSPYSFGFEIREDGTWKGLFKEYDQKNTEPKGKWRLEYFPMADPNHPYVTGVNICIEPLPNITVSSRFPKAIGFQQLLHMKTTKDKAFRKLKEPERMMMKKCGVPLELQTLEGDCCSEIVHGIVNEVWDEKCYSRLGDDVKEAISSRVSRLCMAPPGMTDDEIRVAIASELANCNEWNQAFDSVCN